MICLQHMCKSCDNEVFLLIFSFKHCLNWFHVGHRFVTGQILKTRSEKWLNRMDCQPWKQTVQQTWSTSKNRSSQSLKMKRKQTLAVCHCGLFQHKKTMSFIMLNICCINPYAATGNIWNHHSKRDSNKTLFACNSFQLCSIKNSKFCVSGDHLWIQSSCPQRPLYYKPPLWNVNK